MVSLPPATWPDLALHPASASAVSWTASAAQGGRRDRGAVWSTPALSAGVWCVAPALCHGVLPTGCTEIYAGALALPRSESLHCVGLSGRQRAAGVWMEVTALHGFCRESLRRIVPLALHGGVWCPGVSHAVMLYQSGQK